MNSLLLSHSRLLSSGKAAHVTMTGETISLLPFHLLDQLVISTVLLTHFSRSPSRPLPILPS